MNHPRISHDPIDRTWHLCTSVPIDFFGFQLHVLPVLFGLPKEAMPFCTAGLARGTLLGEDMPRIWRLTCGHRNPSFTSEYLPVWSPRLCHRVLAFSVCLAEQLFKFCKGNTCTHMYMHVSIVVASAVTSLFHLHSLNDLISQRFNILFSALFSPS